MSRDVAGSALDFLRHRSHYLTRHQAATRVEVGKRTIDRYIERGLPTYRVLGTEYVHVDELLAHYRASIMRQRETRATPTSA